MEESDKVTEVWKDIPEYEGLYQVSNLGGVKSLGNDKTRKERVLKTPLDNNGYCHTNLSKNNKISSKRVHQLVGMVFLGYKPNKFNLVINHIDHIKTNNKLSNLEIITQRENATNKERSGSSKYVGVSWSKAMKKWKAGIVINKKVKHLGYFDNEIDASESYLYELKTIKIKEALDILEYYGYYVRNLWSTQDVQTKFECTEEEALDVLEDAVSGEWIIEQINERISYCGEREGLEEKVQDNGNT